MHKVPTTMRSLPDIQNHSSTSSTSSVAPPAPDSTDVDYDHLLAHFPQGLRDRIRAHFPRLPQLQHLQDLFRDRGIPMDVEPCVAYVVDAEIHAREEARSVQRSVMFCDGGLSKYDNDGMTPLHQAILVFNHACVRELLAHGALARLTVYPQQRKRQIEKLCFRDQRNNGDSDEASDASDVPVGEFSSPLEWAEALVSQERRRLALLENKVATGSAVPEELEKARKYAPERFLHALFVRAAGQGGARLDRLGVTVAAHAGENALTLAISCGAPVSMVALLAEHCMQHCPELLNEPDDNGNLPLVLAAADARTDLVRLLLQPGTGVDVDRQNGLGRSALMEAARNGDTRLMEFLLRDRKARCDLTDNHGNTASSLAALRQQAEAFALLHQWEAMQGSEQSRAKLKSRVSEELVAASQRGNLHLLVELFKRFPEEIVDGVLHDGLVAALKAPGNGAVIDWFMRHAWGRLGKGPHQIPSPENLAVDREGLEAALDAICPTGTSPWGKDRLQQILAAAVFHGSLKYVCHALEHGADINGQAHATAPIVVALRGSHKPLLIELVKRGARTFGNPGSVETSALTCIGSITPDWQARELLQLIVTHHPDLYGEPGQAALLQKLAVKLDMPELLQRLVQDGMLDPDIHLNEDKSLLLQLVAKRDAKLLEIVLHAPAPVRRILGAANGNADAALAWAADRSKAAFELVLGACGVSRHDGQDVLLSRFRLAAQASFFSSCELILEKGGLILPAIMPAEYSSIRNSRDPRSRELIALMLQHGLQGCDTEPGAVTRRSPLAMEILSKDLEVAKIILDAGPKANTGFATEVPKLLCQSWINACPDFYALLVGTLLKAGIAIEPAALDLLHQWAEEIGSRAASTVLATRRKQAATPAWRREQERAALSQKIEGCAGTAPVETEQLALLHTAIDLGDVQACEALLKTLPRGNFDALFKRAVVAPWPRLAIVELLFRHDGAEPIASTTLASRICTELHAAEPSWQGVVFWLGELLAREDRHPLIALEKNTCQVVQTTFAALIKDREGRSAVPMNADWEMPHVLMCGFALALRSSDERAHREERYSRLEAAAQSLGVKLADAYRFEQRLLFDGKKQSLCVGLHKELYAQ